MQLTFDHRLVKLIHFQVYIENRFLQQISEKLGGIYIYMSLFICFSQNNFVYIGLLIMFLSLVTQPANICREPVGPTFVCIKRDSKK